MHFAKILRKLMTEKDILVAPGVFDGLSALLVKQAGFPLIYASGGAISRSKGYPDIGLLTMTEMISTLAQIVEVCQIPVIADADTGFGNSINVRRTVREYEKIGVAGLHIEDQTFPKRCGHLNDKSLISTIEMCQKIKVARASLEKAETLLIARTDAIAVEGIQSAIQRACQYHTAGADMIFVEAPETVSQIEKIAAEIPGPKLINMFQGGKTPIVSKQRLAELGFKIVIIPSDLQRASIKIMQKTLKVIQEQGNSEQISHDLASFQEREAIVGTQNYLTISTD